MTPSGFQANLFIADALPKGSVSESNKWYQRIANAPSKNDARKQATAFIKKHKPNEETINIILNWVEAGCPA